MNRSERLINATLILAAIICSTQARKSPAWNAELIASHAFRPSDTTVVANEAKPQSPVTNVESNAVSAISNDTTSPQTPEIVACAQTNDADEYDDTIDRSSRHMRSMDLKSTAKSAAQTVSHRAQSRIALASYLLQRRKRSLTAVVNYAAHGVRQTPAKMIADCRSIYQNGESLLLSRLGHNRLSESTVSEETPSASTLLTDVEKLELAQSTNNMLASVKAALSEKELWQHIVDKDGVNVWKTSADVKNCAAGVSSASTGAADAVTVRSEALMDASPRAVYDLFMDDARVHEYNENCVELADIERISRETKINWCATGKFGPFKARDFVTVVYFRELKEEEGGGYVSLAANVEHPKLPPADGYVRSEIQLAATFMKPVPGEPNKTKLVQMTQIGQMGGVADSAIAKRITQNLAEKAPVEFMKKFNHAVTHPPAPQPKRSGNQLPPFIGVGGVTEM